MVQISEIIVYSFLIIYVSHLHKLDYMAFIEHDALFIVSVVIVSCGLLIAYYLKSASNVIWFDFRLSQKSHFNPIGILNSLAENLSDFGFNLAAPYSSS